MTDFPTHARAVVIGGGVGGCSIAYHLTQMGWRDVVLVERSELTAARIVCSLTPLSEMAT